MSILRYTLISEGTTDANLIPIINWTFQECGNQLVEGYPAEFWRLPEQPGSLSSKISTACKYFPCEVLFIHRDADNVPSSNRCREIEAAIRSISPALQIPAVAIIPVRMLEAWLLTNEAAIRNAAGNPNGLVPLNLPHVSRLESRPDPKSDLKFALRNASELSGRRLKKFDDSKAFWRIVEYMPTFATLRKLSAFARFEESVKRMVSAHYQPGFYSELSDQTVK